MVVRPRLRVRCSPSSTPLGSHRSHAFTRFERCIGSQHTLSLRIFIRRVKRIDPHIYPANHSNFCEHPTHGSAHTLHIGFATGSHFMSNWLRIPSHIVLRNALTQTQPHVASSSHGQRTPFSRARSVAYSKAETSTHGIYSGPQKIHGKQGMAG